MINNLHIFNEIVTYFTCIFLLLFNSFVTASMRFTLGFILVGLVSILIVYNGVIMMRKVYRLMCLLFTKWRELKRYLRVRREAKSITRCI